VRLIVLQFLLLLFHALYFCFQLVILRRDEEIFVEKMQDFDDIIEQNNQLKTKIEGMEK
jgi:hypothetical protein